MSFTPRLSILTSLFRSERFLPSFLEQLRTQSVFTQCEFVLVLNEPTTEEEHFIVEFQNQFSDQVQRFSVEPVETLGASWNRAWSAARAPLMAIWNVDDRRLPDSLEKQLLALENNRDWALCYGDYLAVGEYGLEEGKRRHTPQYSPRLFRRAFPQGGAFWLLRKSLSADVGFFDEQFTVGPDFDLSMRIAALGLEMGRADGLLGYFTDTQAGLSTRDSANRSAVERTAIQLRYGVFDKVRSQYIADARQYRINDLLSYGEWQPLESLLPGRAKYLRARRPLWLLGRLRNALRSILRNLGLLDWLYRFQERFLKREI